MPINTATGPLEPSALGKTLMHEHLLIGMSGWDSDTVCAGSSFHDNVALCCDKVAELKDAGFSSLLDPCPNDLGRDVRLMAEVASRSGFNIVFATGLYHAQYGAPYWRLNFEFDPDAEQKLTDLFVTELTEGVSGTGIKAGVIKIATAAEFTPFEKMVFRAAAKASLVTGAPITTHTDAVLGDVQLDMLRALGVPSHKIIIGHSCGSKDGHYHRRIIDGGAYIGFDRFGLEMICPDQQRVDSLLRLVRQGSMAQIIISHDSVWCQRGKAVPDAFLAPMVAAGQAMRFTRIIAPMLKQAGIAQTDIDFMLTENPRRYFAGEPLPAA